MLYPQRTVCHVTRERKAAERRFEQIHERLPYHDGTETSWAKEPSRDHPYRYDDGVHIWVADTDVNPDDDFLRSGGPAPDDEE